MTSLDDIQVPTHDHSAENEHSNPTSPKKAVGGYIRVSTEEQEKHGMSLDGQADLLRDHARRKGWRLIGLHEDALSASSKHGASRLGLLNAILQAKAAGGRILVASIDRLSRSTSVFKLLETSGLRIHSVKEGRVGKKRLRSLVAAAEKQSAEIARRSREASAKKKVAGKKRANAIHLGQAQRTGAINNMLRSSQKIRDLAEIIASRPDLVAMTWEGRADALNAAGLNNCISEKRHEFKPWTVQSLSKPFKAAMEELAFQDEMDAEDEI